MAALETPVCEFGLPAVDFSLRGVDGKTWTLNDCRGENGVLVMFICNHCPYVKAVIDRIVSDVSGLEKYGIKSVAIMSNDPDDYPEDSFDNMKKVSDKHNFTFPYLIDESQKIAKGYGAICTPDFFGYNADLQLQYRGRLDESGKNPAKPGVRQELYEAMKRIAQTGRGPAEQIPSIGCSIKWSNRA
ncbi:thioredoxin family protein [Candidatus Spongiihabitans sp.]|uniref:thioredoxin family protein n=1 Tax=Candidatus Spongiihabitans sp. TaxID=3101308 RepID=UPI003C7AFB24